MARKKQQLDPPEQVGCPWCGESFITFALKRKAGVTVSARLVCFTCRAQGPIAPTLAEARVKWETRASALIYSHPTIEDNDCNTTNGASGEANEQPVTQASQAAPAQPGSAGMELPVPVPVAERPGGNSVSEPPAD